MNKACKKCVEAYRLIDEVPRTIKGDICYWCNSYQFVEDATCEKEGKK